MNSGLIRPERVNIRDCFRPSPEAQKGSCDGANC